MVIVIRMHGNGLQWKLEGFSVRIHRINLSITAQKLDLICFYKIERSISVPDQFSLKLSIAVACPYRITFGNNLLSWV